MRDYQVISPSLEGVLDHDFLEYSGLERPRELLRILDGGSRRPSKRGLEDDTKSPSYKAEDRKALENYVHDLYAVFLKRLSYYIVEANSDHEESTKLMAMLQEMIKVKGYINSKLLG